MGFPVLIEVGNFDKRLSVPGCFGFALVKVATSFRPAGDPLNAGEGPAPSPAGDALGTMEAYGGVQLSIWDYFALNPSGSAPQSQPGDIYNFIYMVPGINGTLFTETGQPWPIPGVDATVYVVVDSEDHDNVVAGSIFPLFFTFSDEREDDYQGYCINPFLTIWAPSGGGVQIRSNAQDASGYFANSSYPVGGIIHQGENTFPAQWDAIFPPPNHIDFLGNNAGPDPVYPLVVSIDALSGVGGNAYIPTLKLPQTPRQAGENPSAISCTVDSLRADVQLSGGLNYSTPPTQSCSFPFEPDGYVGGKSGQDHRVTIFYFLCNQPCQKVKDWIGWMIAAQVSDVPSVFPSATQTQVDTQVPSGI